MGNVHACSACGHVHEAEELHWDEKEPVPDVLTGRALGRLVPEIRSLSTADRERVGRLVRIGFGIKAKSTGIPLKAKIWLFILFMTVIVDMGLFKISLQTGERAARELAAIHRANSSNPVGVTAETEAGPVVPAETPLQHWWVRHMDIVQAIHLTLIAFASLAMIAALGAAGDSSLSNNAVVVRAYRKAVADVIAERQALRFK